MRANDLNQTSALSWSERIEVNCSIAIAATAGKMPALRGNLTVPR